MSVLDFFRDWIGVPSGYEYLLITIAGGTALVIIDNILRCLFGVISSLFKKGSRS